MHRRIHILLVALMVAVIGCGSDAPLPLPTFGDLKLMKRQWAIEVPDLTAKNAEKVPAALHSITGIVEGSTILNVDGKYVAYKIVTRPDDPFNEEAIKDQAIKKLGEIGLHPGQTKTHVPAPPPPAS